MKIHPLIERLIRLGVDVEIHYDRNRNVFLYDLHSGAKETMTAYALEGGSLAVETRYDLTRVVTNIIELCHVFESCVLPKGNFNPQWGDVMRELDLWEADYVP